MNLNDQLETFRGIAGVWIREAKLLVSEGPTWSALDRLMHLRGITALAGKMHQAAYDFMAKALTLEGASDSLKYQPPRSRTSEKLDPQRSPSSWSSAFSETEMARLGHSLEQLLVTPACQPDGVVKLVLSFVGPDGSVLELTFDRGPINDGGSFPVMKEIPR